MLTEKQKEEIKYYKSKNFSVFEEPILIKLEPANYCTRKCGFCFLNHRGAGFMSMETLNNILDGATSKLKKIEFCLSGEPTMNKNLPEMISLTHLKHPQAKIIMLTNTDMMRTKYGFRYLLDLFNRGLKYIQCDLYDQESKDWFIHQIKDHKVELEAINVDIVDYYKSEQNMYSYGKNHRTMWIVDEVPGLNHNSKKTRSLHTWGGNMPLKTIEEFGGLSRDIFPQKKTCSDPLKSMIIWNNGDVGLCCREGSKSIIFGNVNKENLLDVWQGSRLHLVRQLLKLKRRDLIPSCYFCMYNSCRDGIHQLWHNKEQPPTMADALNMLKETTVLDEGLKANFVEFNKEFPDRVPAYIKEKL